MGIDHPDEDDTPDIPLGSSRVEGDPSATAEHDTIDDSDAAQAAYNVEYRADVEAKYMAAAWDKGVTSLREAWAEHEKRYPHSERSQATLREDGSWHAEGNLELKPEQNTEVDRGCARIREVGEKTIMPGMRSIEAEDSSRHLVGLEHQFKGADRLKEKVADRLRSKPGRTEGIPASGLCHDPASTWRDGI